MTLASPRHRCVVLGSLNFKHVPMASDTHTYETGSSFLDSYRLHSACSKMRSVSFLLRLLVVSPRSISHFPRCTCPATPPSFTRPCSSTCCAFSHAVYSSWKPSPPCPLDALCFQLCFHANCEIIVPPSLVLQSSLVPFCSVLNYEKSRLIITLSLRILHK